jgi:hypothetical protein
MRNYVPQVASLALPTTTYNMTHGEAAASRPCAVAIRERDDKPVTARGILESGFDNHRDRNAYTSIVHGEHVHPRRGSAGRVDHWVRYPKSGGQRAVGSSTTAPETLQHKVGKRFTADYIHELSFASRCSPCGDGEWTTRFEDSTAFTEDDEEAKPLIKHLQTTHGNNFIPDVIIVREGVVIGVLEVCKTNRTVDERKLHFFNSVFGHNYVEVDAGQVWPMAVEGQPVGELDNKALHQMCDDCSELVACNGCGVIDRSATMSASYLCPTCDNRRYERVRAEQERWWAELAEQGAEERRIQRLVKEEKDRLQRQVELMMEEDAYAKQLAKEERLREAEATRLALEERRRDKYMQQQQELEQWRRMERERFRMRCDRERAEEERQRAEEERRQRARAEQERQVRVLERLAEGRRLREIAEMARAEADSRLKTCTGCEQQEYGAPHLWKSGLCRRCWGLLCKCGHRKQNAADPMCFHCATPPVPGQFVVLQDKSNGYCCIKCNRDRPLADAKRTRAKLAKPYQCAVCVEK